MAKKQEKKKTFKVGDKIIDFGHVYRIFKIKNKKGKDGDKKKFIFFRPYFKKKEDKGLVFSIPVINLDKANIRRPLSEKKLKKVFKKLSGKLKTTKALNISKAQDRLNLNNPFKTARILKRLWADKKDKSTNFTRSKRKTFDLAMKRMIEEVALVKDISLRKARDKIKAALEKGWEKTKKAKASKKKSSKKKSK